jgi:XTP/dITP diphosphohydrolase
MNITPRRLIAATGNAGKLREIRQILADLPFEITSLRDHWTPVPDIPETGSTFAENARRKAAWVFGRTGVWTLADDSGLEVDALDGEPGVLSARYSGEGASDEANVRKLLDRLAGVPPAERTAQFHCVMVLMIGPSECIVTEGICRGRITEEPAGTAGFGYDPVFVPDGFRGTFAQLDSGVKNAVSHRAKALLRMRKEIARRHA